MCEVVSSEYVMRRSFAIQFVSTSIGDPMMAVSASKVPSEFLQMVISAGAVNVGSIISFM